MADLPSGTVTLLFSDVEGSTRLLHRLGADYAAALDQHRHILRSAWIAHHGAELGTEGDSFFVAFETAGDAVAAAVQAQSELVSSTWPSGEFLRVRMGIHTGAPTRHGDGYIGIDVHRAARIAAAANGGQIVVSEATATLVGNEPATSALDLGLHRLKDFARPERLYQIAARGLTLAFPPVRTLGSAGSLPPLTTEVIGRDRELAELEALLAQASTRLVTLGGPGGAGKTSLAIALATGVAAGTEVRYPDGVYFVALEEVVLGDGVWSRIAAALDAPPEKTSPDGVLDYLSARTCLLVLDNVEQVDGASAVVGALLEASPRTQVVATSRTPLHVRGELEYRISGLEVPSGADFGASSASAAVLLFVRQGMLVRPGFELTHDNAPDVVAICRRLDGLPLGLELAAARLRMLSPRALSSRLDAALDFQTREAERLDRRRTLRQTIAWSYELLDADQQRLLRTLGAFPGSASLAAIEAVDAAPGDVLRLLEPLVEASLAIAVDAADGEPRVDLLNTIRAFALDALIAADEETAVRDAVSRHYAEIATDLAWSTEVDAERRQQDLLDAESEGIRATLAWLLREHPGKAATLDRQTAGLRVAAEFGRRFLLPSGYHAEGIDWCERALAAAGPATDELAVADCTATLGVLLARLGDSDRAVACLDDVIARLRGDEPGDAARDWIYAWSCSYAGYMRTMLGDYDQARSAFESALTRTGERSTLRVAVLSGLGILLGAEGNPDGALVFDRESLRIATARGDTGDIAVATQNTACTLRALGRPNEAEPMMRSIFPELLEHRSLGDLVSLAEDYAAVLIDLGRHQDGALMMGAAEGLRRRINAPRDALQGAGLASAVTTASTSLGEQWQSLFHRGEAMEVDEALAAIST